MDRQCWYALCFLNRSLIRIPCDAQDFVVVLLSRLFQEPLGFLQAFHNLSPLLAFVPRRGMQRHYILIGSPTGLECFLKRTYGLFPALVR